MFSNKKLKMITDSASLQEACLELSSQPYIGVDLEGDSLHHYKERVCLIQVSDPNFDYIIDPIQIEDISVFLELMADEKIQKVMHGADYDVVSLKRDYEAPINNLFDTMIAAQFLGYPRVGLVNLIHKHFGLTIDKAYQTHDWSRRPLYREHLDYARGDTHFLLALREILQWRMEKNGLIDAFTEECFWQTQRNWNGKREPQIDFLRVKHSHKLKEKQLRILRQLYLLREELAKAIDRPTFRIFGDQVLITLCQSIPSSLEDLKEMSQGRNKISKNYHEKVLEAIQMGLEDKSEIPKHKSVPKPKNGPNFEKIMGDLKIWRNEKIEELSLLPIVILSNGQLRDIARTKPRDLDEMVNVGSVRKWQVKRFGSDILKILHRYDSSITL
jgi:ribonuclease D